MADGMQTAGEWAAWLIGTGAKNAITANVILIAVAAGIGIATLEAFNTLLPYLLNVYVWAEMCSSILAALFGTVFYFLPDGLQAYVATAITWLSTNATIAAVWRLTWYVVDIFCDVNVVLGCFSAQLAAVVTSFALRLGKGVYDLWPTRG